MADIITGVIGVDDVLQGKRVKDFTKGINSKYQDRNPFLAAQLHLSKAKKITNPEFNWLFKPEMTIFDATTANVNVGGSAGATVALPVSEISTFRVNDTIYFPSVTAATTGHTVYGVVTAIADTAGSDGVGAGTLTVCPLDATKIFNATTSGDAIFNYANSQQGWGTPPDGKVVKNIQYTNYPQLIRAPFKVDVWQKGQENYTGMTEVAERKEELHDAIRRYMENVVLFGSGGYKTDSSGNKQYFAAGIKTQVSKGASGNMGTVSGLTEAKLDEYLVEGPAKSGIGSKKRLWFLGNDQFLRISTIIKAKEQITTRNVEIAGLTFMKYNAPNGTQMYMYNHNAFEGDLSEHSIIIDPSQVKIRNYREQGLLQFHEGIEARNEIGTQSEWRSIISVQVMNPYSCGYLVTTA